jgi:hypothetical protein
MTKLAAVAVIPLFAGFLWAQTEQTTRTETTETKTYNGTLVDASCYKTHAEKQTTSSDENGTTTTRTETTVTTECPISTTTTTFGLITPEGQYVHFDEPSNTRIVEVVKSKKWNKYMAKHEPVTVRVVGTPSGDVVVVREIQ